MKLNDAILITGVGKRAGLVLAKHLIAKGHPVVGTYRSEYDELEELRALGAHLIRIDFYQPDAATVLSHELKLVCQSLRAIIHNASDWLPERDNADNAEVLSKMLTIHVEIPYLLNLELSELLSRCQQLMSDIIHITDYVAHTGSRKHIAYSASKAALESLTLSFAAKLAPKTKVNAIAPALLKFNPGDNVEYQAKSLGKNVLPHEGGWDELTNTVDYLMGSGYITGRTLHLDGGRHLR